MVKYVTLTYILAPVALDKLERAEDLTVLGDPETDIDDSGVSTRPVDDPKNLMGAIFAQWHDTAAADQKEADEFVRGFSTNPVEIRKKTIADRHRTSLGDCGRHFQGDHGDTYIYQGFLLVDPNQDDIEGFFEWADDIYS